MMCKKLKGFMTIEAALTIPLVFIVGSCLFVNFLLYSIQGFLHTVCVEAVQETNKAAQIILTLDIPNAEEASISENQMISIVDALSSEYDGSPYAVKAKEVYSKITKMSMGEFEAVLSSVFERELHKKIDGFIKAQIPTILLNVSDIRVTGLELCDEQGEVRMELDVGYQIFYPLEIIGDIEKSMHFSMYLG